jgi:purine-binding chemotaxis protein CheW
MGQLVKRGTPEIQGRTHDQEQYLTFALGGATFGIEILSIKEIIEYGQPTCVPMMPAFIRGVINLRGSVVPVVDLQARFGRESSPVNKRTCIVIVEIASGDDKQDVGIVVDQVNEVVQIPGADIEPAPSFGAGIRTDFIAGMGKLEEKFIVILRLDAVLAVDELARLADGAEAPADPDVATAA